MELNVRADLEGEGDLGEVAPHTVHSDQHGVGPGGPDGQRALVVHRLTRAGLC